jgi:hypothetical protein
MEMTKVTYESLGPDKQNYVGPWLSVDGGIVLIFSENSQTFIPFHKIIRIEQTFSPDTDRKEKLDKSLYNRLNRNK